MLKSSWLCWYSSNLGTFWLKISPVAQLEQNFDGIVIGWSSSKIVSSSHALPPKWPPQCSCVVIESSFDPGERLQAPGSLWVFYWFLWEFPIESYVKLSSAVAAILVGSLKCWTQFWKGATQGSFQQSLVEIGSVVSEKILFICLKPFAQ
jgi:hypothetical protein